MFVYRGPKQFSRRLKYEITAIEDWYTHYLGTFSWDLWKSRSHSDRGWSLMTC